MVFPAKAFKNVVFPDPEPPMIATTCPGATERDVLNKTVFTETVLEKRDVARMSTLRSLVEMDKGGMECSVSISFYWLEGWTDGDGKR